jgi:hypothetical protein
VTPAPPTLPLYNVALLNIVPFVDVPTLPPAKLGPDVYAERPPAPLPPLFAKMTVEPVPQSVLVPLPPPNSVAPNPVVVLPFVIAGVAPLPTLIT